MSYLEQNKMYLDNIALHLSNKIASSALILKWIMEGEPTRILEVGAGSGRVCVLLKRLIPDATVIASDIDSGLCDLIRELAKRTNVDIGVECFDARKIPYGDNTFDICFSIGVVEHLGEEDMRQCVSEQLRVARLIIVHVPLIYWKLRGLVIQGDEIWWTKAKWLYELNLLGTVLDFVLYETTGEELEMSVAMSNKIGTFRLGALDIVLTTSKIGGI